MLPLGWTLASPSIENLNKQVTEQAPRYAEIKALLERGNRRTEATPPSSIPIVQRAPSPSRTLSPGTAALPPDAPR